MAARNYSNIAIATTIVSGINSTDTSFDVADATGWPSAPFTAVLEAGTANEEIVLVASKSSVTFSSVTRGYNGSTGKSHSAGATVKHCAVAIDFTGVYTHAHTGDYALVDHGGLSGLADDDHSAYYNAARHTKAVHDALAIDHGTLTGLADDDHSQYYNAARHTKAVHDSLAIDHGTLTGLADDDHSQYHNDTRGDARYAAVAHVGGTGAAHGNATAVVAGFLTAADFSKLAAIEAAATADQTANEILTLLLTVDGAASLLDADLLDGVHAAAFALLSGATFTGQLFAKDGTSVYPGLAFASDGDSGFYLINDGEIATTIASTIRSRISATYHRFGANATNGYAQINFAAADLAAVAYSFYGDLDTGLYRAAANSLGLAAGGTKIVGVSATGLDVASGDLLVGGIAVGKKVTANPTLKGDTTDPTMGTGAFSKGYYIDFPGAYMWFFHIKFGTSGQADGTGDWYITPPQTPSSDYEENSTFGQVHLLDDNNVDYIAASQYSKANNRIYFVQETSSARTNGASNIPFSWTNSDGLTGTLWILK